MKYLAFDFGASGGRAVLGTLDGGKLSMEEIHRFHNGPVKVGDSAYWDAVRLFDEIKRGIALASNSHSDIASIGIDTWGVDFGLLGPNDFLIGNPFHYRDSRTDGMVEIAESKVSRSDIYAETGIQTMQINTLYQLLSVSINNPWMLESAKSMLNMPDLFNFWLTGVKANEFTISSTSQMYNPTTKTWAYSLIEKLGIPSHILGEITQPGTILGSLRADVAEETHSKAINVIAIAGHDTGSAVLAVPSVGDDCAYISSGTWSLIGIESPVPILSEKAMALNFTNEGGVGSIRFLKNVTGLWLVQECRRTWKEAGHEYSYGELAKMAEAAAPFSAVIDPDDDSFQKPCDMPQKIREYCKRTNQPLPQDDATVIRVALDSLALKYRWVIEGIETITNKSIGRINIVGGGTQNKLLSRLTADVTGKPVMTGPVEATAIGNILMQAIALGQIGSIADAREVVRASFEMENYEPYYQPEADAAYGKLKSIIEE